MKGRIRLLRRTTVRKMAHPQHTTSSGASPTNIFERQYSAHDPAEVATDDGIPHLYEMPNPLYAKRTTGQPQWAAINGANIKEFGVWKGPDGACTAPYAGSNFPATDWQVEKVQPNVCQEWAKWGARYYYFRVLKVVHQWTYNKYALETPAGMENGYFTIAIMPHQGDRKWDWRVQFEDAFGWRSLGHAGAIIKHLQPGGTVRYSCKPSWIHTRDDGTTEDKPDLQWQRTDNATAVTRLMNTIHWRAWSSLRNMTTTSPNVTYYGTCIWPTLVDEITYKRWVVMQFASEKDEYSAWNADT